VRMANDEGMTVVQPTTDPVPRSPAAQRMRLHRPRRRDGRRWLSIEIWETEIERLVTKGLLKADARNAPDAVREALYAFLDGTLGVKP
jgi:hypothetical protein